MNDIRKHSRNSKSNDTRSVRVPIIRSGVNREQLLNKRVEEFENNSYEEESSIAKYYKNKPGSIKDIRNGKLNLKRKRKLSLGTSILIALLTSLFLIYMALTYIFNSATITITPKTYNINSNDNFTFSNDDKNEVYQTIDIKKEVSKDIEKSEAKKISAKAYGDIIIYNNYNENPQKLVKNTRFESSKGKIFRISESIVVPGKNLSGPGSITVKVTADSVGSDYNVAPSRFTIPGFKGSARYNSFYAESKTNMIGGASGQSLVYSKDDIDGTDMQLRSEIRELVKKDLPSIYKKGYSVIYSPSLITYSNNESDFVSSGNVKYTVYGTAQIILLKNDYIAKALAEKYINNYSGENVSVKDISKLKIELASSTKTVLENKITVNILGEANIIMNIDENNLKRLLINKSNNKEEFTKILSNFTEIKQAVPSISPFWVKTFPKNPNKIDIITKEEQK